mgnify:FL=1
MYEALLKNTPEYQKIAASLASPGPAALFGLPPTGRALLYAALQKDTGRILCVVTPGEAELWTTVLGTAAQPYTIQVERVTMTGSDPNRNLLIRVTDKRLLDATGGVVQGMSGSPIVQNGRLAAVLTHVLVNDPSRGYAIFATTMLEKADAVASSK